MNPFKQQLFEEHYEDFNKKSGIEDKLMREMTAIGQRSVTSTQARRLKFPVPKGVQSVLLIPYPGTKFFRAKLFPPHGKQKYTQKKGSGVHLFIPPGNDPRLHDPNEPLYVVEGEKKGLKGAQEGLCCVSIGGIWCWWDKRNGQIISTLKALIYPGRIINLVPDGDMFSPKGFGIKLAVYRLGKKLEKLGAVVRIVCLPGNNANGKVGLDDYLITKTVQDFRQLPSIDLTDPTFDMPEDIPKDTIAKGLLSIFNEYGLSPYSLRERADGFYFNKELGLSWESWIDLGKKLFGGQGFTEEQLAILACLKWFETGRRFKFFTLRLLQKALQKRREIVTANVSCLIATSHVAKELFTSEPTTGSADTFNLRYIHEVFYYRVLAKNSLQETPIKPKWEPNSGKEKLAVRSKRGLKKKRSGLDLSSAGRPRSGGCVGGSSSKHQTSSVPSPIESSTDRLCRCISRLLNGHCDEDCGCGPDCVSFQATVIAPPTYDEAVTEHYWEHMPLHAIPRNPLLQEQLDIEALERRIHFAKINSPYYQEELDEESDWYRETLIETRRNAFKELDDHRNGSPKSSVERLVDDYGTDDIVSIVERIYQCRK